MTKHSRIVAARAALLGIVAMSLAALPAQARDAEALKREIARQLTAFEANPNLVCGLYVWDLRTKAPLIDHRGNEPRMTASNMKLLTTAFALDKLGADFVFTTSVYQLGDDVVVVGDGDPTIGCADLSEKAGVSVYTELDRWAQAIRDHAGEAFKGDLLLCSRFKIAKSRYPGVNPKRWRPWYMAPVGGLNYHDNNYNINITISGGKVTPQVQPASRFIQIVNELTIGEKDKWTLVPGKDEATVTLRGTVSKMTVKPKKLSIDNPAMFLGRVLADRIVRAGVGFNGRIRTVAHDFDVSKASLLYRRKTTLADSLKRMNKRSLNMAAESHYLRAGDGTWAGSQAAMTKSMINTYGLLPKGFTIGEGSGLSSANRVAPAEFVKLLKQMLKRKDGRLLVESLSISGVDGTLAEQKRFTEPKYLKRILAKTGTVGSASCVTGYILDKGGEPVLVFSMMANRHEWTQQRFSGPARKFKDPIIRRLVDYVDE